MKKKAENKLFENLPACAAEFIKLVIRKMQYRRKVRLDVQAELAAHFEDELRDCKTDEEKEKRAQQLITDFGDAKLLAVLMRRAKKRCRPLWRTVVARTCQAVALLFICSVLYIVWFLTGKPAVTTNYVAEFNRLVKPAADENQNAAPLYDRAAILIEELSDETRVLLQNPQGGDTEQKQLIEKWLSENNQALQLLVEASKKPYYWRTYGNERNPDMMMAILMPNLAAFRSLAGALCWRAQFKAEQGRFEDAFDDLIACYLFGRHLKGDSVLIEQIVGIAIEALSARKIREIISDYPIDSSILTMLQRYYEGLIADEDFAPSFKGERLGIYDELQRCFTSGQDGHIIPKRILMFGDLFPGPASKNPIDELLFVFSDMSVLKTTTYMLTLHPDKQQTRETAEQFYDFCEEMARKSPAQVHTEGIDIEKEVEEIVKANIFMEVFLPAVGRIILISNRSKVDIQATLAVIAIKRYKQDTGNYPDSLQELSSAGYLKQLPIDPYSDKPIIYKKTDDNFLLYSVGFNFTDDRGEVYRNDEGKVRLWADEGDTVFWPVQKAEKK